MALALMLLHLGQVPTLVVSSPEMAKDVMRTYDHIFASRPSLKVIKILLPETNDIVFAPYGEWWRQARKLCSIHLFNAKAVKSYQHFRGEEVAIMIDKIDRASRSTRDSIVDMTKEIYSFANDITCRIVSGKFYREGGRNEVFNELIGENSVLIGKFHFEDYFPSFAWLDELFGLSTRAKKNSKRWDILLDQVIEEHLDQSKNDKQAKDFVDLLLSLQNHPMTDLSLDKQHIKALLMDVFAAGTETTYISLEWAMAELARNPRVMRKLQDEVRGISKRKGMVKEDELSQMNYLKAVIKEVLRLHPAAPMLLPHESMEDCQIQGYDIPMKTRVMINALAIGRDPRFWEAPEEFIPERFIGSEVDFKGKDFQFIPFGPGRRMCPGMNFANCNFEIALANLVHQFDWELPPGLAREDLDMTEMLGTTTRRKQRLHLVAKPWIA